jgi:hypothetical protein
VWDGDVASCGDIAVALPSSYPVPNSEQQWLTTDHRGNWLDYRWALTDGGVSTSYKQTRTVNAVNEYTGIDPIGPSDPPSAVTPAYDRAGNLRWDPLAANVGTPCGTGVSPVGCGQWYKYDEENRVVQVRRYDGTGDPNNTLLRELLLGATRAVRVPGHEMGWSTWSRTADAKMAWRTVVCDVLVGKGLACRARTTMKRKRPIRIGTAVFCLTCSLSLISSCTQSAMLNAWAPAANFAVGTGNPTPRAIIVGFINDTPYRAIFTFGAYDQMDKTSLPTGFQQLRLEGNTASQQFTQPCRKTFSVGGDELIRLITVNEQSPSINVTDPDALVNGVNFSSAPPNDPQAAAPTEGTAQGLVVLDGDDFACNRTDIRQATGTGLLLFTFVQDASAPGGFRIDYSFVPR